MLVDDRTGGLVLATSLIAHDRVVCDRNNAVGTEADGACTAAPYARVEGQGATGLPDVDHAYDFAGAVSTFYQAVGGLDLTALLGIGSPKKLAATVRYCETGQSCPYANAFWNGHQMYYGAGYSGADDVVGHEMTHGVIDQYSALFYWGQSGAINESLADVIGEIVDHRTPTAGDSPGNWDLGEDLPGGPLRSMSDPTLHQQPDRMTSGLYTADTAAGSFYGDSGGVHTNSGVGTKTAYLISQGGTFNGQTITGIDGADLNLTKTATLYVEVIKRLLSGSDYADLARTLDQVCGEFVTAGTAGFTAANCTAVHQAGVATELTTTPTNAPQNADAPATCPDGTYKRVLLDGEADPEGTFAHDAGWARATAAGERNATSGTSSWFAADVPTVGAATLKTQNYLDLPTGQESYLWFQRWQLVDYDVGGPGYDGGIVRLETPATTDLHNEPGGTWVNPPQNLLPTQYGNPWGGKTAFSGDSKGWVASRRDLSDYAGQQVKLDFILATDNSVAFLGWYVDDITVYTCDLTPPPTPTPPPSTGKPSRPSYVLVQGRVDGFTISWLAPQVNPEAVTGYLVQGWGGTRTVSASTRSVTVRGLPRSLVDFYLLLQAKASTPDLPAVVVHVRRVRLSFAGTRKGSKVVFSGKAVRWHGTPLLGRSIQLQRYGAGGWKTIKYLHTRSYGVFSTSVTARKRARYRMLFIGGANVVGGFSAVVRR